MSQYLNIYARFKLDGQFVPIADYSRSTKVYEEVDAPYEKLMLWSREEIEATAERVRAGKIFANSQITNLNRKIELISQMNNPLDDKLEAIHELMTYIEEYQDEISALDRWSIELDFIANMTFYAEIYAGIEISDPTEQDVIS